MLKNITPTYKNFWDSCSDQFMICFRGSTKNVIYTNKKSRLLYVWYNILVFTFREINIEEQQKPT